MSFGKKPRLTDEESFQKIQEYFYSHGKDININNLFQDDKDRFSKFSSIFHTPRDGDILVDYSKNKITEPLLEKLLEFAKGRGVEEARDLMFRGGKVNRVEDKAVLPNVLRDADPKRVTDSTNQVIVDNFNVLNECQDLLERMYTFVDAVHSEQWTGCHGKPFTDVVVIGQTGSTLASQMATEALPGYRTPLEIHYINNVDGTAMATVLAKVKRCKTLFVIVSENFDDPIVLRNSETAKKWFMKWASEKDMVKHFVAVTLNKPEAQHFGVHPSNVFRYGEYVTECYSVWGTIGLPLALSIGRDHFASFLAGAKHMDDHFKMTPSEKNIPIILAMIGIWYINFFNAETQAVLTYDRNLHLFPSYVQFLNMKSNGKQYLGLSQSEADFNTSPVVWGGCLEDNCQMLHQGTAMVPCDFIVPAIPYDGNIDHHRTLIAHCLTHSEILMKGWPKETPEPMENPHLGSGEPMEPTIEDKIQDGNRPSTSIVVKKLTPFTLGALMGLFEHKAFVQSVIWDVDPFVHPSDSLSTSRASEMLVSLEDPRKSRTFDSSTNGLMAFIKKRLKPKTLKDFILVGYEFLYDPPVSDILQKGEIFNLAVIVASAYVWYPFFF